MLDAIDRMLGDNGRHVAQIALGMYADELSGDRCIVATAVLRAAVSPFACGSLMMTPRVSPVMPRCLKPVLSQFDNNALKFR